MNNSTIAIEPLSSNVLLVADVVFYRHNRTGFKHTHRWEGGGSGMGPTIVNVMMTYWFSRPHRAITVQDFVFDERTQGLDAWSRALVSAPYLSVYAVSVFLNCLLLMLSLRKSHKRRWKRLPLLIANLAFRNIILSIGFTSYTLLIDVFYSVQNIESIDTEGWPFASFCHAALKEVLKYQITNNMTYVQALFILLITIDRYCSLFPYYDPYIESSWTPSLISVLPDVLVGVFLDFRLLDLVFGTSVALVICHLSLLVPCLLSLVLTVCTIARHQQAGMSYRTHDRSCPVAMLVVICIQLVEKLALFTELLSRDFNFEVVVGDGGGDNPLHAVFQVWFQISHVLLVSAPLYIPSVLLLVVNKYRHEVGEGLRCLVRTVLCLGRRDKIDYNCETMRSIIADQTREKRMRSYASPARI